MLKAHPRSRGEHRFVNLAVIDNHGSSPLARGTPMPRGHNNRTRRLIPARAGNTRELEPVHGGRAAHPRSRGEHEFNTEGMLRGDGSSPLARGTQCALALKYAAARLIPARAGNTHGG